MAIRNVNRDGLGDRRGVALERSTAHGRLWWFVYVDGVVRYASPHRSRAVDAAEWWAGGAR